MPERKSRAGTGQPTYTTAPIISPMEMILMEPHGRAAQRHPSVMMSGERYGEVESREPNHTGDAGAGSFPYTSGISNADEYQNNGYSDEDGGRISYYLLVGVGITAAGWRKTVQLGGRGGGDPFTIIWAGSAAISLIAHTSLHAAGHCRHMTCSFHWAYIPPQLDHCDDCWNAVEGNKGPQGGSDG